MDNESRSAALKRKPANDKPKEMFQTAVFPLTPFGQVKLNAEETNYLVKDLLPRSGLAVVWGPPKSGKSFWCTIIAPTVNRSLALITSFFAGDLDFGFLKELTRHENISSS